MRPLFEASIFYVFLLLFSKNQKMPAFVGIFFCGIRFGRFSSSLDAFQKINIKNNSAQGGVLETL